MAATISDLGKVATSLQVAHIEAVGWGRTAGKVHCNGNILTTAGNITATAGNIVATAGILTLGATSSQIVLGTTVTTTISATAPAASRVLTIPDRLGPTTFMLGQKGIVTATNNALTTLTAADSGKMVLVPQSTVADTSSASAIQLPTASAALTGFNLHFRFTAVGDGTGGWRIMSASDNITVLRRVTLNAAAASISVAGFTTANLQRDGTAADALAGDYVELWCDGTSYYAYCVSHGVASPFNDV